MDNRHKDKENTDRYTSLLEKLITDLENNRQELNHIETHDANLRRRLRELTKQASSLDEVLKNTPIAESDLRRLTDFIEVKQRVKEIEVNIKLTDTL